LGFVAETAFDGLLYDAFSSIDQYDGGWKRDLEGSDRAVIEALSQKICVDGAKTAKYHIASIDGVPAQIRTKHLPNVSLNCYHFSNPLDVMLI
jgi:hypothetical protein